RKKIGITWNTQVSGWVQVAPSSTPCGRIPPSASTAMIVQCPRTTTVIAAARRKSTTRLRVGGVAASTFSALLSPVLVIATSPPLAGGIAGLRGNLPGLEGESLLPLLRGQDAPWRDWAISQYRSSGEIGRASCRERG